MRTPHRRQNYRHLPSRQRGLVLFIALIVLVAMTMAGIGMVRSVDTGTMVAGNLGFKQTAVNSSEAGLQEAYQWLVDNAGGGGLSNTNAANGYYSSRPANEPDWNDPDTWEDAVVLAEDATGNTVSYVIHRMCTQPNTPYNGTNGGVANQCGLTSAAGTPGAGGSMSVGSYSFAGTPQVYYRITARAQGPRNTESYVQAMVAISN
jgi:type IV pilus assembly protein PilX